GARSSRRAVARLSVARLPVTRTDRLPGAGGAVLPGLLVGALGAVLRLAGRRRRWTFALGQPPSVPGFLRWVRAVGGHRGLLVGSGCAGGAPVPGCQVPRPLSAAGSPSHRRA